MAPVVKALAGDRRFAVKVCVTAQHRTMLDQVLRLFSITPDFDLDVMKEAQDLSSMLSSILMRMPTVFDCYTPDVVLVHGDTSTTLAASLAAFHRKIPVAHIEAGLRTGNLFAPWPEEANRKLTATLSRFHFAPTLNARKNLLKEGISEASIFVVGNTIVEALKSTVALLDRETSIRAMAFSQTGYLRTDRRFILVTGHRRESFGEGFRQICSALDDIAQTNPEMDIVYPVHLNPKVRKPVSRLLAGRENIHLLDPLDYLPFVDLMRRAHIILTDSGGIQEEAPTLGKPVLVMRDTTERPEAIEAGTAILVGTKADKIVDAVNNLLNDNERYQQMSRAHNPFGDGYAVKRIIETLYLHKDAL